MTADPQLRTLLRPFETGLLRQPASNERVLCVGLAEPLPGSSLNGGQVNYVQGFRPQYLTLERAGCAVAAELDGEAGYSYALIRLGRHRGQNEAWIASALDRVREGGFIVVAGGKTDGAVSLRKSIARLGASVEHAAKNHGLVFWMQVEKDAGDLAAKLKPETGPLIEGRFQTAPGMFSHGHVDSGSRLLAGHIPEEVFDSVADFCAGWGYLSACALESFQSVRRMHLYEADFASLQVARSNVPASVEHETEYFWHDLLTEPVNHRYDLILMNPPFHIGRKAEPDLGRGLIDTAARSLAPRGRLLMVANRQLPYEAIIGARFTTVEFLGEQDGYKVISAKR